MSTASEYYAKRLENPFAEFLNKIPRGKKLLDALKKEPILPDEDVRAFTLHQRLTLNVLLSDFHVPLPRDIVLAEEIIQLLTKSLYSRVPTPTSLAERKTVATDLANSYMRGTIPHGDAVGRALIGPPGSGKTWTLNNTLRPITQVVPLDPKSNPLVLSRMVTWVKVEAPSTRKISALVNSLITAILRAVGENYKPLLRGSIGLQIQRLAMLCQDYYVGIIIVDEIQHILRKNNEPDIELVNFLVELSNTLNVPLLLVGTPKSEYVVADALRQARRSFGPRWAPLPRDSKSWATFSRALLNYQFTRKVADYEQLEPTLYHYSQGLPALAVALFQYAQHAALLIEDESGKATMVTPEIMTTAFENHMKVIEPMVDALRNGDEISLALFDDLKFDRKKHQAHLKSRSVATKHSPFMIKVSKGGPKLGWRHDAN